MQTYDSHTHHPVPTYLASLFWLAAVIAYAAYLLAGWNTMSLAFGCLLVAVLLTIAIGRLYTVKLQDRIIMLEMKVRSAEVLSAGSATALTALTPKQITALRFASDEELGALLAQATAGSLSPDDIKKAIRQWRPDPHRT